MIEVCILPLETAPANSSPQREADIALVEDEQGNIAHLSAVKILNERGEFSATQGALMPWLRKYTKYIDPWFARGQASVNNLAGIARNRVNKRLAQGSGDRKDLLARLQEGLSSIQKRLMTC